MMMSACEYIVVGVKKGKNTTFNSNLPLNKIANFTNIEQLLVSDKAAAVLEKHIRLSLNTAIDTDITRSNEVVNLVDNAIVLAREEIGVKIAAMYVDEPTGPYLRGCVPNYLSYNSKAGNRLHPTEKPVTILSFLIELLSNPGDTILDPFAGSGSCGEAALLSGRKVVLIEREKDFYRSIKKRIKPITSIDRISKITI
jgi:hypothetical protein